MKIKLSKSQWEKAGRKAGWIKKAILEDPEKTGLIFDFFKRKEFTKSQGDPGFDETDFYTSYSLYKEKGYYPIKIKVFASFYEKLRGVDYSNPYEKQGWEVHSVIDMEDGKDISKEQTKFGGGEHTIDMKEAAEILLDNWRNSLYDGD